MTFISIPRVILIGGASLAGKTTLALRLAARLKYACFSTDDVGTALHAMTTPESHPAIHARRGATSLAYFLETPVERILEDDQREQAALWPAVSSIIRQHAIWRCPAVIEGIALRPDWICAAEFRNVAAVWLEIPEALVRGRLQCDADFQRWSRGNPHLLDAFVFRSVRYNRLLIDAARRAGFPVMPAADADAAQACDACLRLLKLLI